MSIARDLPELIVADAAGWRAWLAQHHAQPGGVRLVLAKTGVVEPTNLTYGEALEEALCHGWIDGQLQKRDETTYYRRFTPRRPSSAWSRRNVEIVDRLFQEGRMSPAGVEAVERAKTQGRFSAQNRYAILYRVETAKRPRREPNGSRSSSQCSRAVKLSTRKRTRDSKTAITRTSVVSMTTAEWAVLGSNQ
jgi:hypothetical protein